MSFLERLFLIIGITIASAQCMASRHNIYKFPNAQVLATQQQAANHDIPLRVVVYDGEQKAIKYVFLDSKMLEADYSTTSDQVSIDLPHLPLGDWNEAHIHLDKDTGTHSISNTTRPHLEMMGNWHPRNIDYLEFVNVKTLQHDRLQVVAHPEFDAPVLIKIASFPWEIPSLEREAIMYQLLHGSEATPEFLGYVTEGSRTIGFITEYIKEIPSIRRRNMASCLAALRNIHQRGIAHGDAHDGNCMIRNDGSSVLVDFELSVETWSSQEFERDLNIMSRCIQTYSEDSW